MHLRDRQPVPNRHNFGLICLRSSVLERFQKVWLVTMVQIHIEATEIFNSSQSGKQRWRVPQHLRVRHWEVWGTGFCVIYRYLMFKTTMKKKNHRRHLIGSRFVISSQVTLFCYGHCFLPCRRLIPRGIHISRTTLCCIVAGIFLMPNSLRSQ